MTRKIELYGVGFNPTGIDTEIEVMMDGTVIYTGTITTDTTKELTGMASDTVAESVMASWTAPDTAGTHQLSIRAITGGVLYTNSGSTHIDDNASETSLSVYSYTESDGDIVGDPNSNVLVDGEILEDGRPENRDELFGQWHIAIPEGSTMTCDFNIDAGQALPEPDSTA